MKIKIAKYVGDGQPFYSIAEIGSNFDNALKKAFKLIDLAKESGADAGNFNPLPLRDWLMTIVLKNLKLDINQNGKGQYSMFIKKLNFQKNFTREFLITVEKKI